jgi:hypothetical protein
VEGLAVDRQYIFWGESTGSSSAPCPFPPTTQTAGAIGRANIDGSGEGDVISLGSNTTRALAADSQHLYWTTTGASGGIARSNLDGTGANTSFISDPNVAEFSGLSISPPAAAAVSTGPADGASQVPAEANVFTVFSEGMDEPSTARAFSVRDDTTGKTVPGSVSWSSGNTTPIFTPSAGYLQPGDRFTATISTAAKAADGMALFSPIGWSFTVAANPVVIFNSPSNGATGVFPNHMVGIGFSQPMNQSSVQSAFSLKDQSSRPVRGSFASFGPQGTIFIPAGDLAPGTTYTASVSTAARDALGHPLAKPVSFSFTTTVKPIIDAVSPAVGATGVSAAAPVGVFFSHAMNETATAGALSVRQTGTGARVPGSVSWPFGPTVAVFLPAAPLGASTSYTVSVAAGATDQSGNPLANPTTWSFTTAAVGATAGPLTLAAPPASAVQAVQAPATRTARDRLGRPLPPAVRLPHIRIAQHIDPGMIKLAHRLRLADRSRR